MNDRSPEVRFDVVPDGTYEIRHKHLAAVIEGEVADIRWRRGARTPERPHEETRTLPETEGRQACTVTLTSPHAAAWQVKAEFGTGTRHYSRDETSGIMMSRDGSSVPDQLLGPDPHSLGHLRGLQELLFDFNVAGGGA